MTQAGGGWEDAPPGALNSLPEVAEQVPSIRDLDGVRGTLANAVAVDAGAIARDNLDARMLAKPRGDRCRFTIGKQVDYFVCLKIDQSGPILPATPPSPVIDPKHTKGHLPRRLRSR